MRASNPHSAPTRLGWTWVLCAEPRGPGRPHGRAQPPRLPAEPLEAAQSTWAPWLLSAPYINSDRSIQVALRGGSSAMDWIAWLSETFHPISFVFGLGFGELLGAKRPTGVVELGGPALENARQALWAARRDRHHAAVRGVGEVETAALASLLDLMGGIRLGWTSRQAQTVRLARTRTGRAVAETLGVGPSVVSESLTAASYRSLCRAEDATRQLLGCYGGRLPDLEGERVAFPPTRAPVSA